MSKLYFSLLGPLLFLVACAPPEDEYSGIIKQNVAYEKLPIKRSSAQVIQMNDRVRVAIRTDSVFEGYSAKFKPNYREALRPLEDFLTSNKTPKQVVVSGYQGTIGNPNKLKKLSKLQAEAVAAYIWAMGISIDSIKVEAYGVTKPVSDPSTASGNIENRRLNVDIF